MMAAAGGTTARMAAQPAPPDRHHALVERIEPHAAGQGPLAGLTFVAKDCLDLKGRAPGCGLASRGPGPAPGEDAAVIRQLAAAGAELVGMAQMTPLAFEPSGDNPVLGRPLNPRDASFVCGGSSSGSAVAVAAGLADLAIGTDTAGSVRIPAHCCGIAAWKPGPGILPRAGVMTLAESLDCVGILASEVDLLARVAAAIEVMPELPFKAVALAVDALAESAPAIRQACEAAIRASGMPIREVQALPLVRACDQPVFALLQGEAYQANRHRITSGGLDPELARRLAKGAASSEADLAAARAELAVLAQDALDMVLAEDEVLALPGMPCETPRVALCDPASPDFSPRALYALSAYTRFANGLGLCVVSLPVGLDSQGMPVGLQLVARQGRDADLIAFAARLAAALPIRFSTIRGPAP